jgi:lambda repressor-like predicted transcriptional regulator
MDAKKIQQAREIRALLIRKGITTVEVARLAGRARPTISNVIAGRNKNPRLRGLIASMVGVPADALWPNNRKKAA